MADDQQQASGPVRRLPGGINSKIFAIGHQPFKGINTQVPRDSIDDTEFSWLENMQPIGKSLISMMDASTEFSNVGTISNPIIYFYMYNSNRNRTGFVTPGQYVFIAFQTGVAKTFNASTGALVAQTTTTGIFSTGLSFYGGGGPLPQATQFNNGGIAIVGATTGSVLYAADSVAIYAPGTTAPTWFADGSAVSSMATAQAGVCTTVWQDRLWIAAGLEYFSSVPNDGTDWTIANGATDQTSTDNFVRQDYNSMQQANGFLYLFGDSSVNVISNIQASGSPTVTTTFNNQNVDPQNGASWQNTVQAFGRGLIYANGTGVYALFGGAAQKISEQLDGIFDDNGNFISTLSLAQGPSSAVAMINNQRCYLLLVPLRGPFDTTARNALIVWDGKKWFIASQSPSLTFIGTQMINSMPTAWGTDGINLYQLFAASSGGKLNKIWQTKLWNGDGLWITKSAYRMFTSFIDKAGTGITEFGTLDSQQTFSGLDQQAFSQSTTPDLITWVNNLGQVVQFQNALGQNVFWTGAGDFEIIGTGLNINVRGNRIGWTAQSDADSFVLTEELLIYQEQSPIGG